MMEATTTARPATTDSRKPPLVTLNALQLRSMAEQASSLRIASGGGDPQFVVEREERDVWKLKIEPALPGRPPAETPLFELDTFEVAPRPTPTSLVIVSDDRSWELVARYDSVFWSEAAVEKFVLPYYASKSLWTAAQVLAKLSYYWYGEAPPIEGDDFVTDGAPFALAHTPDSDWRVLSDPTHDLHLLFRTTDRRGKALRLSELADPPAGWRPGRGGGDRARRTPAEPGGA